MTLREYGADRRAELYAAAHGEKIKMVGGVAIESGIEVPTRAKKLTGMAAVAAKMKIGDSVKLLIPEGKTAGSVAAPLEYQLKKMKRKYTHRAIDGGKAVRIWRV